MKRTTINVEENLLYESQHQAQLEGKTFTALVQAALSEYITAHRKPRRLSIAGIVKSGDPTWASRDEEILWEETDPADGWSPGRHAPGSDEGQRDNRVARP